MNKILLAKFFAAFSSLSAGSAIVATRFVISDTDPATMAVLRFWDWRTLPNTLSYCWVHTKSHCQGRLAKGYTSRYFIFWIIRLPV